MTEKEADDLEAWLAQSPENRQLTAALDDIDRLRREWRLFHLVDPVDSYGNFSGLCWRDRPKKKQ